MSAGCTWPSDQSPTSVENADSPREWWLRGWNQVLPVPDAVTSIRKSKPADKGGGRSVQKVRSEHEMPSGVDPEQVLAGLTEKSAKSGTKREFRVVMRTRPVVPFVNGKMEPYPYR